jgi:hypothetical protein
VWTSVPGTAPAGADPWQAFREAAHAGDAAGVRLASALRAQRAAAVGRLDELQAAIRAHAESLRRHASAPRWRLLDQLATRLILHESDRLWTQAEGHRTPYGELGSLPGEQ